MTAPVAEIGSSGLRSRAAALLAPRVRVWCESRSDRVQAACLVFPPSADVCQVFVISRRDRYDFSLSHELADLEMDLFEDSWPCEVLQVPDVAAATLRSFFDPEEAVAVYGNAAGTPAEG
jgi:hypothetical protein